MPGRRPIFVSLVSNWYYFLRDGLFRLTLEPEAPEVRKAKGSKKSETKELNEKKPW